MEKLVAIILLFSLVFATYFLPIFSEKKSNAAKVGAIASIVVIINSLVYLVDFIVKH